MIFIDYRKGSGEMEPLIRSLGAPCTIVGGVEHGGGNGLDFGDFCWTGKGMTGDIPVGVELKKIADIVDCFRTERWAGHQLPGMLQTYEWAYLLLEGRFRRGLDGSLQTYHRQAGSQKGFWRDVLLGRTAYTYREWIGHLLTLEEHTPVRVHHTSDAQDTAAWIVQTYRHWTTKDWFQHKSYEGFQREQPLGLLRQQPIVRRLAKEIQGIGWEKSQYVSEKFKTPLEMICADEKDWLTTITKPDGKKQTLIGKTLAAKIVKALQSGIEEL